MTRDNLLQFITDLVYFGFPNGFTIYRARKKKLGNVVLKLKQYPSPIVLRCGTSDFDTFDQVFKSREFNLNVKVQPNGCIIDAGANIGLASVFFAYKYPACKVIAIEPEESNYQQLLVNSKYYSNIECLRAAVWDRQAELSIQDTSRDKWGFTVSADSGVNAPVLALSIRDVMDRFNLKQIDLLKIDIEGAELEVFSNNYEAWLPNINAIAIELHDYFRPGTGRAFFSAILKYNFLFTVRGEKILAFRQN